MMRRAWLVAFVFLCAACASRVRVPSAPSRSIDDRLAEADAGLRAGCFDCLVEALTIYEQLAGADLRARRGVAEAAGLLAIRERALGLPDLHYLERARQTDTDSSDAVLFDVIQTLPRRLSASIAASDDAQLDAMMRARRNRDAWRAGLKGREGALAAVTTLAYECAFGDSSDLDVDTLLDRRRDMADTALVLFTTATCRGPKTMPLVSLLTADPRFVEINYFLGQSAAKKDLDEADRRLQLAISWRTEWPAALFAAGDVAELAEEFDRAVDFYERTLAIVPRNPDAQLGHLRALSYAGRHDAALAAADRLLASGRWHTGEAFYWKAWNEAQLTRNDAAWSDVNEASRLVMNADVAKLTGILAIRRGELRVAHDELQKAHARDAADCDTDVLLGGVLLALSEWKSAALALVDAVTCLDAHDEAIRKQIAELRSAAGRERSIARREQQIAANRELRARARDLLARIKPPG